MSSRAILRLLPRSRRTRYGEEIGALLEESRGPGDVINVTAQALRWHMEETMQDVWKALAVVLAGLSLFALGYAINGLADGITELPRHWWSAAPVLGVLLAATLAAIGRVKRRGGAKTTA